MLQYLLRPCVNAAISVMTMCQCRMIWYGHVRIITTLKCVAGQEFELTAALYQAISCAICTGANPVVSLPFFGYSLCFLNLFNPQVGKWENAFYSAVK